MKQLMLLFCYLLFISNSIVLGQIPTGCPAQGLDGALHLIQIADTEVEKEIYTTTFTGDLSVSNCFGIDYDYFEVTIEETNLHIKTTALFADFDKNTPKTSTPMALLNLNCTFTCSEDKGTYIFQFQVTDTNNHPPEFDKTDGYEFMVPIPLMPRIDFTIYGDAIMVTDIDFSNQNIDFTIDPDDFAITTLSDASVKNYTAVFSTRNIIQLTESKSYTITATDSGRPPSSTTTTITIIPDESLSIDTPSFNELSYSFNYTVLDNEPLLSPNDDRITIATLKPKSVKEPTITGEFSGYFSAFFDAETNAIDFLVNELLPTTTEAFIVLTLAVETDNSASTSIVVYIAAEANEAPQFSNHYYVGTYDDASDTVALADEIIITSTRTPNVSIFGDLADNFDITYDATSKSCQILVKTGLTPAELKGLSYITLTLKASVGEHDDTSALILSLPEHLLEFTQALYEATYNSDNTVTINKDHPISFTTDVTEATVAIAESTYSKNFEVKPGSENGQYEISVTTPLSGDVLITQREVLLTLTASDVYGNKAGTAVTIELPEVDADVPAFSSVKYIGNYVFDSESAVLTVEDIAIVNRDPTLTKIELDSYSDNFGISYIEDKWVFSLMKILDEPTLRANKELIIFLTATVEGDIMKGHATLVINLVPKAAPKFAKGYYKATYPEKGDGDIILDEDVKFANIKDAKTVAIELDSYQENFEITYNSDKWMVTIKKPLEDSVISENTELIITLSATETANPNKGSSILVLELPSSDTVALKFDKAYYTAQYPTSGSGTIEFEEPLNLINVADPTKVEITVDNYSDNFDIKYESGKWSIIITKSLPDSVLKGTSELVITLTAKQMGNENTGEAVLIMKLPNEENEKAPQFSNVYYTASYPEGGTGTIEFDQPIEFSNVDKQSDLVITLDSYDDNFEIKYESERWFINIKNSLQDSILKNNVDLVITLSAKQTGNENTGEAVLIMKLPNEENEKGPQFSKAYYTASYPESGTGTIEFEPPIDFSNVENPADITIALDNYGENFDIKYESDKWSIVVKESLPDSVLKGTSELVITLTAKQTGNENTGWAVLILKLPNEDNEKAPHFSNTYYTATYPESGIGTIEFDQPIEFSNVDKPSDLVISLDNYNDNFEIKYESDRWFINIKDSLQDTILQKNSELVMTLVASQPENKNTGESVLVLKLPKIDEDTVPIFSSTYYTGSYPESETNVIEFDPPIQFSNVDNPSVTIALDKYSNNFEVNYDSDRWYINIKEKLDEDTLSKNSDLVMILTAKIKNGHTSEATLILNLPTTPEFSRPYYLAQYPKLGSGVIEFEGPIAFTNVDDPKNVVITLDSYTPNFEVKYSDDRWYINIVKSLDDQVLEKNVELVITLKATANGGTQAGEAVLVLQLPTSDATLGPKFSEAYYVAKYSIENTNPIEFDPPLDLQNIDDPKDVAISLDKYSENFEVVYSSNKWQINILTILDDPTLKENAELLITLTAKDAAGKEADAALVLELPATPSGSTLSFAKPYYLAKYPESGTADIEVDTPIEFLNTENAANVKIRLDSYTDNFDIVYKGDKWLIQIKQSLGDDVLQKDAELVMALIATEPPDTAEAKSALVLKLPSVSNEKAPRFNEVHYLAKYPQDGNKEIEFQEQLEISNIADQTSVTISVENYEDYFEVKYESDKWHINILKSLDDSMLHKDPEIVMTLVATETGNTNTGKSVLVLQLPVASDSSAPTFSKAYYLAKYAEDDTGIIEFEDSIAFDNVDDPTTVTITLDNYSGNLEVIYDKDRWYIHLLTPLDKGTLEKNSELYITLTATKPEYQNEGHSTLILKLPVIEFGDGPVFSEAYYVVKYPTKGVGIVEFENPMTFLNINNQSSVKVTLDNYTDNFEIVYDESRWFLYVKHSLDPEVLKQKAELVMTLFAVQDGKPDEGYSALVIELPQIIKPEFSEAYYVADYPEEGTGTLQLDKAISFLNIDNPKLVTINLDNYGDNFEIKYDADSWQINIIKELSEKVLQSNQELVMTLIATESGNTNQGHSAFVLRLPAIDDSIKFSESYYLAKYPTEGATDIEFEKPITFDNVDDIYSVKITLDNYADNFEIEYVSDKWQIQVKKALDEDVLEENQQLVMTLTAVEAGKSEPAYSILVLELPVGEVDTALKFEQAYYVAKYSENEDKTLQFENDIKFLNAEDPAAVTINLDKYEEYFEVTYTSEKWILNVKKVLGEDILNKNVELVMTMTAKETGDEGKEGHSALVIELPRSETESRPIFSDSYYLANYPVEYTGSIEFESPVAFENVDDSTVTITLDNYADNFDIVFENGKWLIVVKKNLEASVLDGSSELVITLIATDKGLSKEGKSALVLRLPPKDETAPIFSDTYYTAKYTVTGSDTKVVLENPIDITNKDDIKTISVSIENYKDNFGIDYDNDAKSWVVKVIKAISDDLLLEKTDLTLAITATNVDNDKKDHAAINLALPYLDTEKAPKFAHTIYTALYSISGDQTSVTFDTPLEITNKDNLKDITIGVNNYDNFEIVYDEAAKAWKMNVLKNLDQSILNERVDLAIELTAIENGNDEIGQTALILRLPVINNEDAPKFSSIYYYGTYVTGETATVDLEKIIEITNKADLSKVTISFDTSYRDNFEITYNADKSQFELKTKTPLSKDVFKDKPGLILTLTATEDGNSKIGQTVLVLHLPIEETKLPPKFNNAHYTAKYTVDNHKGTLVLDGLITVVNKEDLSKVSVALDSYGENFDITFDSTKKQWDLGVKESLPQDLVESMSELILTLTATEADNENNGESTLIVSLGSSTTTDDILEFSEVHYSADYHSEGKGSITTNDKVKVNVKDGSKTAVVTIESEDYATYFNIEPKEDVYEISLTSPLPTEVLEKETSLVLTLVGAVDEAKAYATLVINLPVSVGDTIIRFEDPLYSASYKIVDGKAVFAVEDTIKVATDEEDANVERSISSSTGYESYFKLDYSENEITVSLDKDLPEDVLRSNTFIPLVLTVGITGTTAKSSAVLNIEINTEEEQRSIAFSGVLYGGKYEVTEGNVDFTVNDKITINTDEADENVEVKITNEFESFFSVEYSAKEVVITLHKNLTADTLGSHTVVPVTLQAAIKDTSYVTSAVLNIEIRYDGDSGTDDIEFDSVLYTGEYSVFNGVGLLETGPIRVITNREDDDIEIYISDSEYAQYFSIDYSNLAATVQVKTNLPDEVVEKTSFISLTLSVGIKDTALTGSSVLNIIINNEHQNRAISFSKLLYAGKYTVTDDGKGNLEIGQTISLETTESDENVKVSVTNEYESYFSVDYSEKLVTISIKKPLTDTILDSLSVVPLVLQAEISGTSVQSSAVLNIAIIYNSDGDTQSIEFASVLYNGQYTITNGSENFKLNDLVKVIATDTSDDQIQSSISDDSQYGSYFDVSYSDNTVSVKLAKSLPSDVTKSNSFIALTLIVEIKDTPHTSSAVLNIDIQNNDNNDNNGGGGDDDSKTELDHLRITFIVVTSVLSVLLIACIAGAIAYYFLRIRGDSYDNLEEDGSGRVRFGKHSLTRSPSSNKSSALEERRPTGFIFHPINEDMSENGESPTDLDKARRKSVAFDDNVEKMQIDLIKDDDINIYSNDKAQVTHV